MAEPTEKDPEQQANWQCVSPTDSLNAIRPSQIIPPDSPVRFGDLCKARNGCNSAPHPSEDSNGVENDSSNGSETAVPECLTPTLQNSKLSQMLVDLAHKDKNYIGGEMLSEPAPCDSEDTSGAKRPRQVGQTPTPVECLSPFWAKAFPAAEGDDISKDRPGGEKGKQKHALKEKKKSPMTLTVAEDRFFVVNNDRVVEDGACMSHNISASDTAAKSGIRYFHEGAVMELVPGKKPSMKLVNAINPTDSIDGGSKMTEILKQKLSPVEQCFVESGFCAYLVLNYTDPEKPQLEALNSPDLHKKLQDLDSSTSTLADKRFTPLVNIAREASSVPEDQYTTTIYFTTDQYNYFVHVENQELTLKKFNIKDNSPSANPRNNKQFRDKVYPNVSERAKVGRRGKEEVDSAGETFKPEKKFKRDEEDSFDAKSPSSDSADGSSGISRSSSSQASSPDDSNASSTKSTFLLTKDKHDSDTLDSGVEAN